MSTRNRIVSACILLTTIFGIVFVVVRRPMSHPTPTQDSASTRYVAIGDSYTIGEGVSPEQSWPAQLTERLKAQGVLIELIANPSRTGWTTQDAINRELPIMEQLNPNFATLLIGVNDWVQEVSAEKFREHLVVLMDRMLAVLKSPDHLVVVTIPDFGVTPTGKQFGSGRDISAGIASFNLIIQEEAKKRNLTVVDIFELSKGMGSDSTLVNRDGLHPSGKEYALWAEKIFLVVLGKLKPQ